MRGQVIDEARSIALVKYSFLWQKRFGVINKFGMDFDKGVKCSYII